MKRQLSVSLLLIVIVSSIFLGCLDSSENTQNETNNSNTDLPDTNFELVNYTVITIGRKNEILGTGFIHSDSTSFYDINITIYNNYERTVDVNVTMKFYDDQDLYLDSLHVKAQNISEKSNKSFLYRFPRVALVGEYRINSYDNVDHVSFELREDN